MKATQADLGGRRWMGWLRPNEFHTNRIRKPTLNAVEA
jgi:hypothetical protein